MNPSNFFPNDCVPWKCCFFLFFLIANLSFSSYIYGQDYISHHSALDNNPSPNLCSD